MMRGPINQMLSPVLNSSTASVIPGVMKRWEIHRLAVLVKWAEKHPDNVTNSQSSKIGIRKVFIDLNLLG